MKRERRLKCAFIEEDYLVAYLNMWRCELIAVPRFQEMPQDVQIEGVHYNYRRQGFDVVLWHESFDIVPPGQTIPWIDSKLIGSQSEFYQRMKNEGTTKRT